MSLDRHAAIRFLSALDDLRWPGDGSGPVTPEDVAQARAAHGETYEADANERGGWASHVTTRLDRVVTEYGDRALRRRLLVLLDELSEESADIGAWAVIAHQALEHRDDLEEDERELIGQALSDAALAGAHAWARIGQARAILRASRNGEAT